MTLLRVLTNPEKIRFLRKAKELIDGGASSAQTRVTLAEEFGLNMLQVQNLINRGNMRTGGLIKSTRKVSELSKQDRANLVAEAKQMHQDGVEPAMIKAKMNIRYGIREQDVTMLCRDNGLIIATKPKVKRPAKIDAEPEPRGNTDLGIENNLFMKAAQKVDGAQYIPGKGCFLNGVRINGFALAMKADLQHEVWQ